MAILEKVKERFGLSGFQLKVIALVSMILDHIAACLPVFSLPEYRVIYFILRGAGRLAFPLYAFLLAEGALKTHDIKKYLLRLGLFALLSELPFDLARGAGGLEFGYQNTLFTLFAGLLAIAAYRYTKEHFADTPKELLGLLALIACLAAAHFLNFDYGAEGVLLIFGLYMWRTEMRGSDVYPFFLMALYAFIWFDGTLQPLALLAFFLMHLYNDTRGRAVPKLLFYWIYPLHLLILALLRLLLPGVVQL